MKGRTLKGIMAVLLVAVAMMSLAGIAAAAESVSLTYDNLNRLKTATYGTRYKIEYWYDAAGNRTQKTLLC